MLWGATTVATAHEAVAAGIDLLDLASRYGDGKAEEVIGEAFAGRLPDGVRVTARRLTPVKRRARMASRERARSGRQ
jgi:aryl-alcohol dehydrogenase-like predicted oxidoreductase